MNVADLVSTNVLGDATMLAGHNVRVADGIQQAGLTVVNVTHDGDNRCAGLEDVVAFGVEFVLDVDVELVQQLAFFILGGETTWSL